MLTKEQKDAMTVLRLNGYTLQEIGEKYGVTRQAVHKTVYRGLIQRKRVSIFKDYCAIWRSFMENGNDMSPLDIHTAFQELSKKHSVHYDGVADSISYCCKKERENRKFRFYTQLKTEQYVANQRQA